MNKKLDFILTGFQKCSTSSFMYTLNESYYDTVNCMEHKVPEGFTSQHLHCRFEVDYFRDILYNKGYCNQEWYNSLLSSDKINVDRSHNILWSSSFSIPKIYESYPNVKLIFIIRNPIDRAWSAWNHIYNLKKSEVDHFTDAKPFLQNRTSFIDAFFSNPIILDMQGQYAKHIKKCLEYFSKEQIFVAIQENFLYRNTSQQEWDRVIEYMGLEQKKIPHKMWNVIPYKVGSMNIEDRQQLKEYYEPSVKELEDLLDHKIDQWKDFR